MSNGGWGEWNWVKSKSGFRFWDSNFGMENKRGRLGRFKNQNGARKEAMNS